MQAIALRRPTYSTITAFLMAVLAGFAVYAYLSWTRAQLPITGKLVSIPVASQDLRPGDVITPSLLDHRRFPQRYLPEGAVLTDAAVVGRTLSAAVFAGEPLTTKKFATSGVLSAAVPRGMRAYTLQAESGLGVLPSNGDRIDVLVTLPRDVYGTPQTTTVLRSKLVTTAGSASSNSTSAPKDSSKSTRPASIGRLGASETRPESGFGVTVLVSPEEAQKLALAQSLGRITVILAPNTQDTSPPSKPTTPENLSE